MRLHYVGRRLPVKCPDRTAVGRVQDTSGFGFAKAYNAKWRLYAMGMPNEVAVSELRSRLAEALSKVERGETITVTRNGRPVARLVPDSAEIPIDLTEHRARYSKGVSLLNTLTEEREGYR
jgi:prevent-host-death family protein